jgi:hypothetical protein
MKKTRNKKTKLMASIAITILLLTISTTLMAVPSQAQEHGGAPELTPWPTSPPSGVTPNVTVECTAFMSFSPKIAGQGQTILVNLWQEPPTHVTRYRSGYTVTFTKPDGSKDVVGPMNSYQGDTTAWFNYQVNEVGEWTVQFTAAANFYPAGWYYEGQVYYNETELPPGPYGMFNRPIYLESAYYEEASTPEQTLIVQEDFVLPWPTAPLPTDYWTRPISPQNREWWSIAGHYPFDSMGGGPGWPANTNAYASNYKFTPYVQAPNTAHIAWRREYAQGGLVGGEFGYSSFYLGGPFGSNTNIPNMIFAGRAYQTYSKPGVGASSQTYWQCYDIRTGEIYWERPLEQGESRPTNIMYEPGFQEVPGSESQWTSSYRLVSIGSRYLVKYDPWTGTIVTNVTGMSGTLYRNPYVLSVQNLGGGEYRLINWTIQGTTSDFTERVMNNISFPFSRLRTTDYESMITVNTQSMTDPGMGTSHGTTIMAASLETGEWLWNATTDDITFSSSTAVADHGKFAVRMLGGWWDAWNLEDGTFAWKSDVLEYPWGDFGAYTVCNYGGTLFDQSYAGIYAINWTNGKIAWRFEAPNVPFESPYGGNPWFQSSVIADGKLFAYNTEHTLGQPQTRGWKLYCINANTGENIWNITGPMTPGAVADGYLAAINLYDGYMYVFGKGKSETTVTAPDVAVPKGTAFTIKGTVLDMSPGQPGTPCVSVDSMTTQMNYLHMQSPIDGTYHNETITGVPVKLTAISSSGSSTPIGTTTTEGYHGTFGLQWTPASEGTYEIVASFEGDDSYGSSSASTWVTVGPAPSGGQQQETEEPTTEAPTTEAPTTEAPTTEAPTTEAPTSEAPTTEQPSGEAPAFPTTEVAIIVAAVAVAIVIGVGAYWALRRRK